jgi:hypothetical protein
VTRASDDDTVEHPGVLQPDDVAGELAATRVLLGLERVLRDSAEREVTDLRAALRALVNAIQVIPAGDEWAASVVGQSDAVEALAAARKVLGEGGATASAAPDTSARADDGPLQFGDDWPGVFLRGDTAAHYAISLRGVLDALKHGGVELPDGVLLQAMALDGLLSDLEGCRVTDASDPPGTQRCRPWAACVAPKAGGT